MNVESDILIRAFPKMVKDAIWIRGVISGLLKICVARKPEIRYEKIERIMPIRNSKVIPASRMFLICVVLFS